MSQIARLRIELLDVEPPVMRRIEAPIAMRLDDLHEAFQIAMGWENYHLYEFRLRKDWGPGKRWGIPDPDVRGTSGDGPRAAARASLADLLGEARGKTFYYVYDFGDDWLHKVKVEAVAVAAQATPYPRLVEAKGRCPPEDVGGPWGYADYLDALADPDHERHEEMIEWAGPDFNPALVDEDAIRQRLAAGARRVPRRKTAKRAA